MKHLLIFISLISLVACEPPTNTNPNYYSHLEEVSYQLKDGRTVICLRHAWANSKGGLSCDWSNATRNKGASS
ncbi:hypothetical protein MIS33_08550 [Wielerella bovis]|uniref:hypothetical protein n=1 Tax=Wielerella bovis TaxID=2917790 RepID=UPI0020196A42|nr:hypothetical protein [Wielerella bovis]ULJ64199.1 hypothetical protein MIS33_08550 [Wielerella bovis]